MELIAIVATAHVIGIIIAVIASAQGRAQRAQIERIKREQEQMRLWRAEQERRQRVAAAWKKEQERAAAQAARERETLRQRQTRLAKEQERQRKEQERQAAQLAKHEEQIMKLEMRIHTAEGEIAFNREQRERLFKLLDIEELERDASVKGSTVWQKHHKKVISLENQIHTVQKRIDKAHMDKAYCESKLAS